MSTHTPNSQKPFEHTEASCIALLRYYNSQTMTHGGYLIGLFIGFLTLVSRFSLIGGSIIEHLVLFMFSWGFFVLAMYILGRTLLWGQLASKVLNAKLGSPEENTTEETTIYQLHLEATRIVFRNHPKLENFMSYKPALKYIIERISPVFCIVLVIYLVFVLIPSLT